MKGSPTITVTELVGELRRLKEKPVDGYSSEELMSLWACCRDGARKKLKSAIDAGLMEFAGVRMSTGIDGRSCRIPLYRLVGK